MALSPNTSTSPPVVARGDSLPDRAYWEQYCVTPLENKSAPVLNHGDLFPEHILVTDGGYPASWTGGTLATRSL